MIVFFFSNHGSSILTVELGQVRLPQKSLLLQSCLVNLTIDDPETSISEKKKSEDTIGHLTGELFTNGENLPIILHPTRLIRNGVRRFIEV